MIGIAVNHARRHIRAAARRRRATEKLAADRELAPNVALDASEMLERKRLADSLSAALDELPIDQRVAFVLCEAEGRTSIEAGGRTDVEAAIDSDAIGTVMLRHGGRHWHNVYGVGGQRVDTASGMPNNDLWMLGLGVGPSFHIAGLPADLDAIAWHVNHGSAFEDRLSWRKRV